MNRHDGFQLIHDEGMHSTFFPIVAQGRDPLHPVLIALAVVEQRGPAAVQRIQVVEHDVELLQHVLEVGDHAGVTQVLGEYLNELHVQECHQNALLSLRLLLRVTTEIEVGFGLVPPDPEEGYPILA